MNRRFVFLVCLSSLCKVGQASGLSHVKLLNATPFAMHVVLNFCDEIDSRKCSIQQLSLQPATSARVPVPSDTRVFGGQKDRCFASMSVTVPYTAPIPVMHNGKATGLIQPGTQSAFIERDLSKSNFYCIINKQWDEVRFAIVNVGTIKIENNIKIPQLKIVKFIQ